MTWKVKSYPVLPVTSIMELQKTCLVFESYLQRKTKRRSRENKKSNEIFKNSTNSQLLSVVSDTFTYKIAWLYMYV